MSGSDVDWSRLEQIPALPPPPGVVPNFDNPESREELAKIVVGFTYALMVIFLSLRIYTRACITNYLGVDDYLSIAAGASITVFTAVSISLFGAPLGPHQWNVRLSDFNASFLERTLVSIVLFSFSSLFVRAALLALYLRVFAPSPLARVMIKVGLGVIVVFYVVSIALNISFCVPISMTTPVPDRDAWARKLKASTCSQPVYNLNAAVGVFGVISDLYVLLIPVSMVYNLRIPRNRKIGILGIFLTGLLAVALSILSTAFRFLQLESYDFTWDSIPSYTLRAAELNIGMICNCMPVVFIIMKRTFQHGSHKGDTPMRRTRSPSHAYIEDLERNADGHESEELERQLPMAPKPAIISESEKFIRPSQNPSGRTERSTYTELTSINSDYHGHLRDG